MARLVRDPKLYERCYGHRAMPQLEGFALERYNACVGNRIGEFPENDNVVYWIEKTETIRESHRLSYEAESILWLLLWWAIQANPLKGADENRIYEYLWLSLTGGEGTRDPRHGFVSCFRHICHPVYRGLDELLRSLFEQLSGYQEQVAQPLKERDSSRMKDEYLHEAFQRTILGFIVKNINEPFMREPISPARRPKEGEEMAQSVMTSDVHDRVVKRDHATMAGEEMELSDNPNKRSVLPQVSQSRRL